MCTRGCTCSRRSIELCFDLRASKSVPETLLSLTRPKYMALNLLCGVISDHCALLFVVIFRERVITYFFSAVSDRSRETGCSDLETLPRPSHLEVLESPLLSRPAVSEAPNLNFNPGTETQNSVSQQGFERALRFRDITEHIPTSVSTPSVIWSNATRSRERERAPRS